MKFLPSRTFALDLDSHDELASSREAFVIHDPDLLYMDGNSLGRLPKAALERVRVVVEEEWGCDLIRGWNKGWWGQKEPFAFSLDFTPAPGMNRFLVGTQPMIAMLALEAALDPLLDAGLERVRKKSVLMTEYLIYLHDTILAPLGFRLGSPREIERRGSHVSIRHPEGYRINRTLIEEMNVIPDFRAPDNLRLGLAPLYTSFIEVWDTVDRIRAVILEKRYEKYPKERLAVT